MHYQKVKGLLSKDNGMNIYRGCTHGLYIVILEVNAIIWIMILKIF